MDNAASINSRASSIDPLALSYDDGDTQHPMSSPRLRRSSPLGESSPNKQSPSKRINSNSKASVRRESNKATVNTPQGSPEKLSTPTSTRTLRSARVNTSTGSHTGKVASSSKVRKTVEHEHQQMDGLDESSPSRPRTRTTKVPLNDAQPSQNPPRRRGRPRKSEAHLLFANVEPQVADDLIPAESVRRQRRPTPARVTRKSDVDTASVRVQLDELDERDHNVEGEKGEETLGTQVDAVPSIEHHDITNNEPSNEFLNEDEPGNAGIYDHAVLPSQLDGFVERHLGDNSPAQIAKPNSRKPIDFSALTPLHQKPENAHVTHKSYSVQLRDKSSQVNAIRTRVPTPRKPLGWLGERSDSQSEGSMEPENDDIQPGPNGTVSRDAEQSHNQELHNSQPVESVNYETSGIHVSGWDASFPDDSSLEENIGQVDDTLMPDDTVALNRSAVESEGFSMVSFESLKQQRELAEKEAEQERQQAASTTAIDAAPRSAQTSRNTSIHQADVAPPKTTPSQPLQSPRTAPPLLSSPLRQSPTRKMSPAVRAGSVLQEALSSPADASKSKSPPSTDRLFAGFGDNTRKQMRRSMAVGEILARAEPSHQSQPNQSSLRASEEDSAPDRLPTPEDSVSPNNAIPSANNSSSSNSVEQPVNRILPAYDEMSWKATTVSPAQGLASRQQRRADSNAMSWRPTTPPPTNESNADETQLSQSQRLEKRYQQERDDVIRQARDANSSQIVVIDSSIVAGPSDARRSGAKSRIGMRDADGDLSMRDASVGPAQPHSQSGASYVTHSPTLQLEDIFLDEADRSMEDSMGGLDRSRPKQAASQYRPPRDDKNDTRDPETLLRELPDHTPDFIDILGPDDRPMRGKLPRTWRTASGKALLYSDESGATPEKASIRKSGGKRPGVALESPSKDDNVPSVFKRLRSSSHDRATNNMQPTAAAIRSGREKVISSPSAHSSSSMASSPPKEVHFADTHARFASRHVAAVDEEYFSSDEEKSDQMSQIDSDAESDNHTAAERTFLGDEDEGIDYLDENSSGMSHSRTSAAPTDASEEDGDISTPQATNGFGNAGFLKLSTGRTKPSEKLNLSPRKDRTHSNLFGPSPVSQSPKKTGKVPRSILKNPLQNATEGQGLLSRAASWLWLPSYFKLPSTVPFSFSWTSASSAQTTNLTWNQNHTILMIHYFNLANNLPTRGPNLPPAFYDDPIPDSQLRFYIGKPFTTKPHCTSLCPPECSFGKDLERISASSRQYSKIFTERDARVAWAFMSEVLTRGVPLIRGEKGDYTHATRQDRIEKRGVVRDPATGKVKRHREKWPAVEVALEVFAHAISLQVEAEIAAARKLSS